MINIAITEDISVIAETLKEKVELSADFKVKFIASNGRELLKQLQQNHNVDVVIMDINMPELNGIETTEKVTQQYPNIKIIMSTIFDDEQNIFDAIMAGASGYLLKDESPAMVHRSIFEALEGGAPMSSLIARKSLSLIRNGVTSKMATADFELTAREEEILKHIAQGLTYDQVSDRLYISNGTVRKHVENIYKKMKVHNKIEAIQKGKNTGIL
ncbi:MAG: response regulator transcription factor [Putridiphycobacter sp.]|nr:response regulator transcription factor [Putridiphycobacter sp.]